MNKVDRAFSAWITALTTIVLYRYVGAWGAEIYMLSLLVLVGVFYLKGD